MADQLDEYRKQMQQRYRGNPSAPSHPPPASSSSRNQHNDEEVARKMQEEENKRRADQLRQDEELARKLQGDFQPAPPNSYPLGTPVYPPPPQGPGYRPPEYIPAGQPVPPASYGVPPNNYPPNNYPPNNYPPNNYPPNSYPPPNYQPLPSNPSNASRFSYQGNGRNSSQANPVSAPGCLPQVQDKCLGINTQVCVLASAALMTIGIIATLIALSS